MRHVVDDAYKDKQVLNNNNLEQFNPGAFLQFLLGYGQRMPMINEKTVKKGEIAGRRAGCLYV